MIKYSDKVRKQRLCCTLNQSCFVVNHLKPFVYRHRKLVAKVLANANDSTDFEEWFDHCRYAPGYPAGYLFSVMQRRTKL